MAGCIFHGRVEIYACQFRPECEFEYQGEGFGYERGGGEVGYLEYLLGVGFPCLLFFLWLFVLGLMMTDFSTSEERWKSEGIQIGGMGSSRGVFGNWFDK